MGERYGMSLINDFNANYRGLDGLEMCCSDETEGLIVMGNLCFALVHGNTPNRRELIYTNAYYYIGHFSKFIKPEAKRIAVSTNRTDLL